MTNIAWNWFEPVTNCIQEMASLKEKLLKRFSSWGQMQRKQHTHWYNMKFDHTKHDVEQFVYDLKVLGKMICVSDDQIYEHFKKSFLPMAIV